MKNRYYIRHEVRTSSLPLTFIVSDILGLVRNIYIWGYFDRTSSYFFTMLRSSPCHGMINGSKAFTFWMRIVRLEWNSLCVEKVEKYSSLSSASISSFRVMRRGPGRSPGRPGRVPPFWPMGKPWSWFFLLVRTLFQISIWRYWPI